MAEEFSQSETRADAFLSVWKLVPAEEMQRLSGKIRVALGGGIGYNFHLHPESGHFTWGNSGLLHKNVKRNVVNLKDEASAIAAAMKFMQSRNELLGPIGNSLPGSAGQSETTAKLFPPADWLKPMSIAKIANQYYGYADHWLCKFAVVVIDKAGLEYPVVGAEIDIRITEGLHIATVTSRWRPLAEMQQVKPYLSITLDPFPFAEEEKEEDHHADEEAGHTHEEHAHGHVVLDKNIVYLLQDDNEPQTLLAPYEAEWMGEDHMGIMPASHYSLWIEFAGMPVNKGGQIIALIIGGSGTYEGEWFFDPFFDPENHAMGRKLKAEFEVQEPLKGVPVCFSTFEVPKQAGDVSLVVRDKKNSSIITKGIFVRGIAGH